MFLITNHNHYKVVGTDTYDEYSMLYTEKLWPPGTGPERNLYLHKKLVTYELRRTICDDIDQYINITAATINNNNHVIFELFVMDAERSALIKLTYS